MQRCLLSVSFLAAIAALSCWASADAQDRGRGGFDPGEMLRRADENGNGQIDPDEMNSRSGGFIRGMAERAGMDPNRPVPLDKLSGAMEQMRRERFSSGAGSGGPFGGPFGGPPGGGFPQREGDRGGDREGDRGRDGDRDRDRDNDRDRDSSRNTVVPSSTAFSSGTQPQALAPVPGFDVPLSAGVAPAEERYSERVIDNVEDMMQERDSNRNGVLERNEWTGRWSTPPEQADLNKDGILSKEEMLVRSAKRYASEESRRGDGRSSSSSGSGQPGPPAGGSPWGGGPGGGWGGDRGRDGGGRDGGSDADRMKRFAQSMIGRYDENRSGSLERDEMQRMPPDQQAADANKDGVITADEMAGHLQNYARGGGGWGGPRGGEGGGFGGPRGGEGDRGNDSRSSSRSDSQVAVKKSYRFTPPTERLPDGMPDWFLRNDANGDGQISMAEYARSWSEQLAEEFMRHDLNGDGMITPDECQPSDKR